MTAAYRMKGLGWFAGVVVIVLGFYLVSLQVATERNKLDLLNRRIRVAERDIRALETEFDTRGNLAQLERWNGDTLALAAPTAGQFVADEAQLAGIDVMAPAAAGPNGAVVRTAALVVPSMPQPVVNPVATPGTSAPAPLAQAVAAIKPAVVVRVAAAPMVRHDGVVRVASIEPPAMRRAAVSAIVPGLKVRPQRVALLDRNLLSESTLGDILSGARAESGRRR